MSLLDEVRKLEQRVVDRLKELEPLTREYEQLRKLAERLGLKYSPKSAPSDADTKPPATTPRGGTGARAGRTPGKPKAAGSPARGRAAKPRATRSTAARRATATGAGDRAAPARGSKRTGTGGQPSGARRRTAARPGQRHDEVLRLVGEQPGITVREIGARLGVDSTGLYRVVKRLTDDGRVRKDGTGLYLVEPATVSSPPSEAASATASQAPADSGAQTADASATAEPESAAAATDAAPSRDT